MPLRQGAKWHEAKPFASRDVMCLATCRQPHVKGPTIMVKSIFSGACMGGVWLDK